MRLERHDDGGRAELARAPRDVPEHGLVPEVHAVEVSDGHDAAAGKIDGTEGILDDLQRRVILSDDLPHEVVGVRLGDRHAHDLPDARHPALGHLVDEDAAVDLGGLAGRPPLEQEVSVSVEGPSRSTSRDLPRFARFFEREIFCWTSISRSRREDFSSSGIGSPSRLRA